MPTDHSLLGPRRSDSQAGRRRFDPGRPLFFLSVDPNLRRNLPMLLG